MGARKIQRACVALAVLTLLPRAGALVERVAGMKV